jgi:hypothetical protein
MVYDEAGNKLVKNMPVSAEDRGRFSVSYDDTYELLERGPVVAEGLAVGDKVASRKVRVIPQG